MPAVWRATDVNRVHAAIVPHQIAAILHDGWILDLSVKTVEAHKANAMRKLGLTGRIDIVKYAILQGWLDNA